VTKSYQRRMLYNAPIRACGAAAHHPWHSDWAPGPFTACCVFWVWTELETSRSWPTTVRWSKVTSAHARCRASSGAF